jgi:hypothetical protein
MSVLSFDRPKPVRSNSEHNNTFVADSAPPGAYVPNMSEEDSLKWKAKRINKGKEDERIEIQKKFSWHNGKSYPNHEGYSAQTKIIVQKKEPRIIMSTNGKIAMSSDDVINFQQAIAEAFEILKV